MSNNAWSKGSASIRTGNNTSDSTASGNKNSNSNLYPTLGEVNTAPGPGSSGSASNAQPSKKTAWGQPLGAGVVLNEERTGQPQGQHEKMDKSDGRVTSTTGPVLPATLNSTPIHKNFFDYYIVLDFEATCDDKIKMYDQEIIEFPSVLVDAAATSVVSEFQRYVRPVRHPQLTKFCTELTGITQAQVDAADEFPTVFGEYLAWLDAGSLGTKRSFAIVTCGDWDLKSMLPTQLNICRKDGALNKNFKAPKCFDRWINLKNVFEDFTGKKAGGMAEMLQYFKKPLLGKHHSGIDDCRNIATLLIGMLRAGHAVDYTGGLPPSDADYWLGSGPCALPPASLAPAVKASSSTTLTEDTSGTTTTPVTGKQGGSPVGGNVAGGDKKKQWGKGSVAVVTPSQELIPVPDRDPVAELLAAKAPPSLADSEKVAISKRMSHALRHGALEMGLPMTRNGFVALDAMLALSKFRGVTASVIADIVKGSDKQRYLMVYGQDGLVYIRANQGHSIEGISVDMNPITDPKQCPVAIHGTYYDAWKSIQTQGLKRMKRQHIHFGKGMPGDDGVISGMRSSCEVVIFLDVALVLKDQIPLFESTNGVILCPGVGPEGVLHPRYIAKVVDRATGKQIYP